MRKPIIFICKTEGAVTAQLISTFVFFSISSMSSMMPHLSKSEMLQIYLFCVAAQGGLC